MYIYPRLVLPGGVRSLTKFWAPPHLSLNFNKILGGPPLANTCHQQHLAAPHAHVPPPLKKGHQLSSIPKPPVPWGPGGPHAILVLMSKLCLTCPKRN